MVSESLRHRYYYCRASHPNICRDHGPRTTRSPHDDTRNRWRRINIAGNGSRCECVTTQPPTNEIEARTKGEIRRPSRPRTKSGPERKVKSGAFFSQKLVTNCTRQFFFLHINRTINYQGIQHGGSLQRNAQYLSRANVKRNSVITKNIFHSIMYLYAVVWSNPINLTCWKLD